MNQQNNEQLVFLEAHTTGTNSLIGGGPSYAKVAVGSIFSAQLKRLSKLCEKEALCEVRISYAPDMWGPKGVEEEMRMECPELVVTKRSFWFVDRGRHSDAHIETGQVELKELFEALASANGPIYLGIDPEGLERTVLDDTQDDDDEEGEAEAFR